MKVKIVFLSIIVVFITMNIYSSFANELTLMDENSSKFLSKKETEQSLVIEVKIVNKDKIMKYEPLFIRAKVFKKEKKNNISLAKVVSGSYKSYILVIKKELKVKIGGYIRGYLYKNLFAISSERGGMR